MTPLPFFLTTLVWNYGLGMTYVVVPLYAHAQGLSGAEIGTLFSLPVVAQVAVNLLGGAYTDRLGGRRIVLASSLLMSAAALLYIVGSGFATLFIAQGVMVVSRAAFWPAAWSMASELPGARGVQMGRVNAITNAGQIAGTASCGFILAFAGFTSTFLVFAFAGLAAWILALRTPRPTPRAEGSAGPGVFAHFPVLMRMPVMAYMMMCAYVSALPFTLSMSFLPLLLQHYAYGADSSGVLLALRAVGSIAAGLLVGRFVRTGPGSLWPVGSGVAVALAIGALPLVPVTSMIAALMLLVGLGSGVMTLYFQITISEVSSVAQRGSAMALGGLGWGISHLSTPLIMGVLTDRYGIVTGFYAIGAIAMALTLVLAGLRRRAFAHTALGIRAD
ncbi:MAG TPA: MFS transporter [Burkholderiales bacterium]